jgi:hypothetical protein
LSLTGPQNLQSTPAVADKAIALARHLAYIDLTKFRFRIGCGFIGLGVVVFFLGHSIFVARYFTSDFTAHSWRLTIWLLALGAAFAGKEVVEAFGTAFKSLK